MRKETQSERRPGTGKQWREEGITEERQSRLCIPVTYSEKLEIYKNESGCSSKAEAAERQERELKDYKENRLIKTKKRVTSLATFTWTLTIR